MGDGKVARKSWATAVAGGKVDVGARDKTGQDPDGLMFDDVTDPTPNAVVQVQLASKDGPRVTGFDGEFFVSTCASITLKGPSGTEYNLTSSPLMATNPLDIKFLKSAKRVRHIGSTGEMSKPVVSRVVRQSIKGLKTLDQLDAIYGSRLTMNPVV